MSLAGYTQREAQKMLEEEIDQEEHQFETVYISKSDLEKAKWHPSYFYKVRGMKITRGQHKVFCTYAETKCKKLLLRWSRGLGKTRCIAMLIIFIAITQKKRKILLFAQSEEQVKLPGFYEIRDILEQSGLDKYLTKTNELMLTFKNGSFIKGVGFGGKIDSKRGPRYHVVWGDETGWMGDEIGQVVRPFMLNYDDALYIQTSTPGPNEGIYYSAHVASKENWLRSKQGLPYIPSKWIQVFCTHTVPGKKLQDGIEGGDGEFLDENFNGTGTFVASKEALLEELDEHGEESPYWKREYLCMFGTLEGSFFDNELIRRAALSTVAYRGHGYVFDKNSNEYADSELFCAVDIGQIKDYTVIYVGEKTKSGELKLIYKDTCKGESQDTIISKIMSAVNKFDLHKVTIDGTGMGHFLVETAQKKYPEVIWDEVVFDRINKPDMLFDLKIAMERGQIMFSIRDKELMNELSNIVMDKSIKNKNGYQIYGAKGHDDHVIALALLVRAQRLNEKGSVAYIQSAPRSKVQEHVVTVEYDETQKKWVDKVSNKYVTEENLCEDLCFRQYKRKKVLHQDPQSPLLGRSFKRF